MLDQIDSTNDFAKRSLDFPHANSIQAIIAREQTRGRGRFSKSFISKKDASILMTFRFEAPSISKPHQLTQVLSYTTCLFFKQLNLHCEIKWPNDLFIKGEKLGGILLEKVDSSWILGIGLNINQTHEDLEGIDQKSTSYFIHTKKALFVQEAAMTLAKMFLGQLNQLFSHGFELFSHQINEQFLICQEALWHENGKQLSGQILGLDQDGYLLFESAGTSHLLQSGSITLE